jgi:hypothetical protein
VTSGAAQAFAGGSDLATTRALKAKTAEARSHHASAHVLFVGRAAPAATAADARGQDDLAQPSAATKAR